MTIGVPSEPEIGLPIWQNSKIDRFSVSNHAKLLSPFFLLIDRIRNVDATYVAFERRRIVLLCIL